MGDLRYGGGWSLRYLELEMRADRTMISPVATLLFDNMEVNKVQANYLLSEQRYKQVRQCPFCKDILGRKILGTASPPIEGILRNTAVQDSYLA